MDDRKIYRKQDLHRFVLDEEGYMCMCKCSRCMSTRHRLAIDALCAILFIAAIYLIQWLNGLM